MKKFTSVLCIALSLWLGPASAAKADSITVLSAVATTGASTSYSAAAFKRCYARVTSASGSVATVTIEGDINSTMANPQIPLRLGNIGAELARRFLD